MAVVSRVASGVIDKRQGWSSPVPPEAAAAYNHPWKANPVPHPAELKAQSAQREIEREAERRAQNPEPRQSLRDAHARRAETRAELDRVLGLRRKANDLVAALEQRHTELVDLVRAGNRQAADLLITALGQDAEVPTPHNEALQNQLESVSGRLGTARDAMLQLSEEHRRAVAAVRETEALVARCAVELAVDHAVVEAEAIEQINIELQARRSSLNSLTSAITSELRRLPFQAGLYLPPICSRVLAGLDARVDPLWSARLARLREDPESSLD